MERSAPTKDEFGNLQVWLPVGRDCLIDDPDPYEVGFEEVTRIDSLATLLGAAITVWHPAKAITPYDPANRVGTCLGKFRIIEEEKKVEALCSIHDLETIRSLENLELTEVSPSYYLNVSGKRIYNHLALLPEGFAKGGREMKVKFESLNNMTTPINNTIMTIDEGTISKIAGLCSKMVMEGLASMAKDDNDGDEAKKKAEKESYDSGMSEGLAGAKALMCAEGLGYVGESIDEAKAFIIDKKFSNIKLEGKSSEFVQGLLEAAMVDIKSVKAESVKAPEATQNFDIKVEGFEGTPKIELKRFDFSSLKK